MTVLEPNARWCSVFTNSHSYFIFTGSLNAIFHASCINWKKQRYMQSSVSPSTRIYAASSKKKEKKVTLMPVNRELWPTSDRYSFGFCACEWVVLKTNERNTIISLIMSSIVSLARSTYIHAKVYHTKSIRTGTIHIQQAEKFPLPKCLDGMCYSSWSKRDRKYVIVGCIW